MKTNSKSFFVISALLDDSSPLGKLRRLPTEKEAIEHAKAIINRRAKEGNPPLAFHVLKVVSVVEPVAQPVRVRKLK